MSGISELVRLKEPSRFRRMFGGRRVGQKQKGQHNYERGAVSDGYPYPENCANGKSSGDGI